MTTTKYLFFCFCAGKILCDFLIVFNFRRPKVNSNSLLVSREQRNEKLLERVILGDLGCGQEISSPIFGIFIPRVWLEKMCGLIGTKRANGSSTSGLEAWTTSTKSFCSKIFLTLKTSQSTKTSRRKTLTSSLQTFLVPFRHTLRNGSQIGVFTNITRNFMEKCRKFKIFRNLERNFAFKLTSWLHNNWTERVVCSKFLKTLIFEWVTFTSSTFFKPKNYFWKTVCSKQGILWKKQSCACVEISNLTEGQSLRVILLWQSTVRSLMSQMMIIMKQWSCNQSFLSQLRRKIQNPPCSSKPLLSSHNMRKKWIIIHSGCSHFKESCFDVFHTNWRWKQQSNVINFSQSFTYFSDSIWKAT